MDLQSTIAYTDFPDDINYQCKPQEGGGDVHELINIILSLMRRYDCTFAIGESMTGGMLANSLQAHDRIEETFLGGIIVHAASAYENILEIPGTFLRNYGMASKGVAAAMSARVAEIFHADYSIAVTGNAGPDTVEGPIGIVYIAFHTPKRALVQMVDFSSCGHKRNLIRERACYAAFKIFVQILFSEPKE